MYITDPAKITTWSEDRLMEGYLQNRLGILEHALENARKAPDEHTVAEAVEFIAQASGVALTPLQFSHLLDLYPYAKAKVADYGWGDTEVREMVLDVVANAFLGTRWPMGVDKCDIGVFTERLRFAATRAASVLAQTHGKGQ
jgi:hypothetical protein